MLLWKNWLLQKKQPIRTILIVLYPIFISAFLVVVREIAKPAFRETPRTYGSFSVFEKSFTGQILPKNKVIVCVPDTTLVARIVNRAATIIGIKLPKSASQLIIGLYHVFVLSAMTRGLQYTCIV